MFALVSALVGAFIGAGFASGKELATFFVVFGQWGMVGIFLMIVLFVVGGHFVLWLCDKLSVDSYEALLAAVLPSFWAKIFAMLVSLGLWLGLALMLVGCATLGAVLWDVPFWLGFCVAMVATYHPLALGKNGFLRLGSYLVPIMVTFAVVTALIFLLKPQTCVVMTMTLLPHWSVAALLYWLYNNLLVMAVLISLRRRSQVYGAVGVSALIIGGLALLLSACLMRLSPALLQTTMPLLTVAQQLGKTWAAGYGVVMLLAMYTTALANCHSLVVNYTHYVPDRRKLLLLILLPAILFGAFDFGRLVNTIYPLLGYTSVPIMVALLVKAVKILSGGRL